MEARCRIQGRCCKIYFAKFLLLTPVSKLVNKKFVILLLLYLGQEAQKLVKTHNTPKPSCTPKLLKLPTLLKLLKFLKS